MKFIYFMVLALVAANVMAAEHTVEMKTAGADGTMVFEPAVIKVAVGDTVHFAPTDVAHNSESVAGLTPESSVAWKGDMSQKVSVTFDKEGIYVYHCLPHAVMAMIGRVVAGKPTNLEAIKANASTLTNTFAMNNDRLDKYLTQAE